MASYLEDQTTFRLFGEELSTISIDMIGAKNLELEALGTPADTSQLLQQMGSIKELLKAGSLKTARNLCLYIAPNFSEYSEILNEIASRVTAFLQGGGYES